MNLTTHRAGPAVLDKATRSLLDRMLLVILVALIAIAAAWTALVAPKSQAPGAAAAPIAFDGPAYVEHRQGERGAAPASSVGGSGSAIDPRTVKHIGNGGP